MRTAKKVLSVILALMIVVGTLVVAVSAYAEPTTEVLKWSLKAEVFDAAEGAVDEAIGLDVENNSTKSIAVSKTNKEKADVTAYKKVTDHNFYDSNDVIEVKPGQVVWVTVNINTNENCYMYSMESFLFYSNNMFLSSCYKPSLAYQKNPDSVFLSYATNWSPNSWAYMVDSMRNQARTCLTAEENGKFNAYKVVAITDINTVYEVTDEGLLLDQYDEDIFAYPIYVKPDAPVGTTGQIKMAMDGSKSKSICVPEGNPEAASADWIIVNNDGSSHYNIDDAVLNFVVVGDAPALDTARIDAAIASVPADLNGYTAASVAAVNTALAAANDAKANATTQAELDAAAAALEAAVAGLEEEVVLDFARLNAAIASVPADLSGYTTSTADAVEAALAAAQVTFTAQPAIDAAAIALENAVAALAAKANMAVLNEALAAAATVVRANYTPASLAVLDNAVTAGQALVANADEVSDQAAVVAAAQAIQDAKADLVPLGASYSPVETAIARYNAMNKADYTNASKAVVDAAIAAVQYGLPITEQATVDGYAAAINEAIDNLVGLANLEALRTAYTAANTADPADYDSAVWTQIQGYKSDAAAYLFSLEQIPATEQTAIDTLTANINTALANKLGEADYTGVTAAIAAVPADLTIYTNESVAALNAAIDAVQYGLKSDKQGIVDGYADDINAAILALAPKAANLTALNTAITRAKALNAALYTADSYAAVTTALAAAEALKAEAPVITRQGEVDAAAAALETAIGNLVFVGADFSALKAKLDEADALDRTIYTADSLAAFDAAIAPAYAMYANAADYDINDQAEINAMVTTATNAFALLTLKGADYTAVDAAETRAAGYVNSAWYPAELWNAFQAAKAAVVKNLPITEQETVDGYATALVAAMDALDAGILDADYAEVNRQLTAAEALNEDDYKADSWAALQAAINAVETGLKKDRQLDVNDMAVAIFTARRALVAADLADYTAVNDAIDAFEAIDTALYTEETVAAVNDAIDAVDFKLNENHQAEVDAFAAAINAAIRALELKPVPADYTALQNALAEAGRYSESVYTAETWAVLAAAVAAGEEVPEGLLEADQATIDDAAAAILAAIRGLEEKPAEGKVLEVSYTEGAYATKNYTFKVEGRQIAVRFVQKDNTDSTITLYRNRPGMTIKHYNAEGQEVSDMSRDIAYEIWTTELRVQPNNYVVIAKSPEQVWESLDLGLEKQVKLSATNTTVSSFEAATEVVNVGERLDLTVTTGADVIKVQILVDGAEVGPATFDAATYGTLDGNGNCTYNVFTKLAAAGDHTLTVRIRTVNGWEVSNSTITVTAVK